MDFASKTVVELRKIARENNIKIPSGINKAEIVSLLESKLGESAAPEAVQLNMLSGLSDKPSDSAEESGSTEKDMDGDSSESSSDSEASLTEEAAAEKPAVPSFSGLIPPAPVRTPQSTPAPKSTPAAKTAPAPAKSGQPHYRSSWHNASASNQSKFSQGQRTQQAGWNTPPTRPQAEPQRSGFGPAAGGFGPRFGPAASGFGPQASGFGPQAAQESASAQDDSDAADTSQPRPFTPPTTRPYEQKPFNRPVPLARNTPSEPRSGFGTKAFGQESSAARHEAFDLPSIDELITPAECAEAAGVLEVLPDGYGFIRSESLLPSSHDFYVPAALVRRYELRSGDYVSGRVRPSRDGEKYAALLYVTSVNGQDPDTVSSRTLFEDLTPVYSSRRLHLDHPACPDIRMMDLLAPVGFGNRILMLFPPDCGKRTVLCNLANAIHGENENVSIIMLFLDMAPEEVTSIRDSVPCPVLASTFDQSPESQVRLIDLAQERANRLAESGNDVILIVDSLTRLVKTFAASQSNRQSGSIINPSALFRAKKLFGSARCAREGGSLTVFATMDIESGVKLDDSIVEEFRSNANTEIQFDAAIARMGITPALHYQRTRSHRSELLLDLKEQEGLLALRELLSSGSPASAVQQLLGLIDKVAHNQDVLMKIKNWSALMSGRRS